MSLDSLTIAIAKRYTIIPVANHKIHLHSGDDIIFLDTDSVLSEIVLSLDGSKSINDLIETFGAKISEEKMIAFFLELRRQDLAEISTDPEETNRSTSIPEINMLESIHSESLSLLQPFSGILSQTNVLVVGDGRNAEASIDGLERVGFESLVHVSAENLSDTTFPSKDVSVAVVVLDEFRPRLLQKINSLLVSRNIPIVYGAIEGNSLRLGPTVPAGAGACLRCYILRQAEHNPYIYDYENYTLPHLQDAEAIALLGSALASEAARLVSDVSKPEYLGCVRTWNLWKEVTSTEKLIPLFDCPDCSDRWAIKHNPSIVLNVRIKTHTKDGGHRAVKPSETVAMYQHLIGRLGIVASVKRIDEFDSVQLPIFVSYSSAGPEKSSGIQELRLHCGKGVYKDQSKASAIFEAVERYCSNASTKEVIEVATWQEMGKKADEIEDLSLPIYQHCVECGRNCHRFATDMPIEWVWGTSLGQQQQVPIPANMVFHHYQAQPGNGCRIFLPSNSNGLAAGNNLEEAIFHAACEVIERDAVTLFHRAASTGLALNVDAARNPLIGYTIEEIQRNGLEITIQYLPQGVLTTILVILVDRTGNRPFYATGSSSHTDPELALLRALTEANHVRVGIHWSNVASGKQLDVRRFDMTQANKLMRSNDSVDLSRLPDLSSPDIKEDIELILQRLQDVGSDILVYDLTRPGVDVPVVRVISPGLQPGDTFPCLRISRRLKFNLKTSSLKDLPQGFGEDFLW